MASRFDPQHAKAVLLVVEGYPLHKPGKHLARFVSLRHDGARGTLFSRPSPSSGYTANLNRSNRIAKRSRSGLSLSYRRPET